MVTQVTTEPRTHDEYTVGWVCPLPKEQTAAMAMLDRIHPDLSKPPMDNNVYTLGSVGMHNVVIAGLPMGNIGNISAAIVTTQMVHTFPSIKFCLMVGIGGGIPPNVRLGDVVVSTPTDQYPGVVQWDFGKAQEGGKFKRIGALDNPPKALLAALAKLKAEHAMRESMIPKHLDDLGQKWPKLVPEYIRSDSLKDVLFAEDYPHRNRSRWLVDVLDGEQERSAEVDEDGDNCRFCDTSRTINRKPRDMRIHYGLIASGEKVIKDATERNRLNEDLGGHVLCVDMEAAGLLKSFPGIVIRGICDYADSHKNKKWQEHAAAVAAAFAKEFLSKVPMQDVEQMSATPKGDPSPTPYWNDSAFMQKIDLIGRDKLRDRIHSHLSGLKTQGKRGWVCLWGPGGIGKTQLAAAYALRYQHDYSQVFKICGDSPESIQESFARLTDDAPLVCQGSEPTLPWPPDNADAETRQKILRRRVRIVHHWFQTHKQWLLVIDDVRFETPDLFSYIPKTNHGAVIITTQSRGLVGGGLLLEVPPLECDDAATLLLNKANKRDQESQARDRPDATKIAEILGYLPLAVEHAGALIGIRGMEYFLETFHSSPITILDQSDITSLHQPSVFRTFQMSFDVLKERNLCAARFLTFLAFLANTTISSEVFLDEGGVPRSSLKHMRLFQTKAEFDKAVSDLHALALIKCEEDHTSLSLHPLVHHMTRARLSIANLMNWTKNSAEYLYWPLYQSQPVLATAQHSFTFKTVCQILKLAAELDIPEPLTDGFLWFWEVLARLLLHYCPRWHAHGGMEELELYSQRAIAVLKQHPDQGVQILVGSLVSLVVAITKYTNTPDTLETVSRAFISKHLRPATATALQYAAGRGTSDLESFEPVRFLQSYQPRTFRAVLKISTPVPLVPVVAFFLLRVALDCAANKRWHEALALAQFAELRATLLWPMPNPFPASQLITTAFRASKGQHVTEYLRLLESVANRFDDGWDPMAAYDRSRIIFNQGLFMKQENNMNLARKLFEQVECEMDLARKRLLGEPAFSPGTTKGGIYLWIVKALYLARARLERPDAQEVLLEAYDKVRCTMDDDTLSMLHIEMLLALFHGKDGVGIELPAEDYDRRVADRFKRMYAPSKAQLLKAEGLHMGIVLLSQGSQEEAAAIFGLFRHVASAMFKDKEHELARRAERFRLIAEEEMEKEAENVRNGDCWLHFGSAMFQRDARGLVVDGLGGQEAERWGQGDKAVDSWAAEESRWVQGVMEVEAMVGGY